MRGIQSVSPFASDPSIDRTCNAPGDDVPTRPSRRTARTARQIAAISTLLADSPWHGSGSICRVILSARKVAMDNHQPPSKPAKTP